ncbi:outer membrane beta-barrel protein [Marinagarivorans cellulosilyticus]|uniref:Outer membrane protein beta-barrel domain-containing protein n=1 Tax=Marinagarivorans cellulosilyticus TaxID=2721545 RepID=A0AAN2BIM4_9GAMM|nr:outer membrane beta-barrel protein [Marinagarivorans cellulosilyticus]BCD96063.1 hypothetical protein MARGE09_P0262 [Marinagarivorans cellulosilyticus]
MKKLLLIALSTSLAMGANAADERKFYAGAAGSFWKVSDKSTGDTNFNLSSLEGAFGYEALPWLAVEARFGFGVERQTEDLGGNYSSEVTINDPDSTTTPPETMEAIRYTEIRMPIKAELNYYGSIYLKPQMKNDVAVVYGLIGYTMFDADFSEASSTYQGDYTGDINDPATWSYVEGSGNTTTNEPVEYSESEGSFSMGVGVGFYFKDRYVFNIEYKNLVQSLPVGDSDTTLRINGVTLGVNYSF